MIGGLLMAGEVVTSSLRNSLIQDKTRDGKNIMVDVAKD
jgi:hypothetical protein